MKSEAPRESRGQTPRSSSDSTESSASALPAVSMRRSLAIGGVAAIVAFPLYLHGLVPLDEGLAVHVADRLSRGEVLYRDVATGVGPGLYYLLAAFYLVAPPTLELARIFQVLLLGVQTVLVHRIATALVPRKGALLAAFLFAGASLFPYRYPNYSPVAVLFQLVGVLLLLRFARSGSRATLLWAGAALGLCALSKQNYGVFALAAGAASLLLLRLQKPTDGAGTSATTTPRRRLAGGLRDVALLAAGALVPGLTTLLLLWLAGALPMLWQYSVRGVFEGTTTAFTKPYALLDPRDPFFFVDDAANYWPFPPSTEMLPFRTWRPILVPAVGFAYLLPVVVILLQSLRLAASLARRRASAAHCVLVPAAALFLLGVLPRADYFHLTLVVALVWVLLADLVIRLPQIPRRVATALLVSFAVIAAAAPYAQVLLPTSERLDTPLRLERAPWLRAKEAEARGLRAAVGWLEDTTGPDEPVLVLPRDPLVYFLADRANASPYPLKLPGAFQLDGFEAALARVDTVMVRDTGHDELPLFRLMPEVWRLLRRDFVVAEPYLDRLQVAGGPPPEMQPIFAMRRRENPSRGSSTLDREPDLALLEGLVAAPPTILNPELGAFVASAREQPRLIRAQWLLEPAVLLRPPSGWQKFGVAVRGRPAPGSVLRFQVALRPPQLHDRWQGADGAFFEVLAWDPERRAVERLHLESLDARELGVWRWREVAVPLERYADREVVFVLAATPGPSLREVGDEVLVTPPRLEQAASAATTNDPRALSSVSLLSLPRAALDALARFDDPAPFAAALANAGALRPEERARIHLALGLALSRSRGAAVGRDEVARACALAPLDAEAHLAAAELAAAAGDVDEALRRYAELLELEPDHPRALAMSAGYALDRGDLDGARGFAARADRPDAGLDTHLLLARLREAEGDSVGAGSELLEAATHPGDTGVALELLNRWFAGEVARLGDAYLTRCRVPMPDDAFASEVEVSELPLPRATPGQALRLSVVVRNRSPRVWPALGNEDGGLRVALGLRWRDEATGVLREAGRRPLPRDLGPGEEVKLTFRVAAPGEPGAHELRLDVVQEGIGWFGERAGKPAAVAIEVSATP